MSLGLLYALLHANSTRAEQSAPISKTVVSKMIKWPREGRRRSDTACH
jgi:hypothetical protein